jgi:CheY-like chemotaxis protein
VSHRAPQPALIVDDNPEICQLIESILYSTGMEALVSKDSAQAAELLHNQKFDAIFMDVNMPDPDGIELTRLMRASGCNQKTTVIMMTGTDDPYVLRRGFQAGANFLLFKPVNNERLLNLSRLAQSTAQRERRRFQRVPVSRNVQVALGGDTLEGETIDVSFDGLLVRAARTFEQGSRVSVRLCLSSGTQPITANGIVVRLVGPLMGIHLEKIGNDGTKRLQDFLLPFVVGGAPMHKLS